MPGGGEIQSRTLIHARIEPEIVFVTRHALRGAGCQIAAVLAATDFVLPGIEVIDSRYRDFKFDLKSVVADNTSAARVAVGGTTEAVTVKAGDNVTVRVQHLGSVSLRFI